MRPPKPKPPEIELMGGAERIWPIILLIFVLAAFNVATALVLVYFDVGQRNSQYSQSTTSEGGGMHISPIPIGPKLGNGLYLNPGWAP